MKEMEEIKERSFYNKEDFKKRSREKEQVLARQLQNEINKNL